jgi:hypothetical protein
MTCPFEPTPGDSPQDLSGRGSWPLPELAFGVEGGTPHRPFGHVGGTVPVTKVARL